MCKKRWCEIKKSFHFIHLIDERVKSFRRILDAILRTNNYIVQLINFTGLEDIKDDWD